MELKLIFDTLVAITIIVVATYLGFILSGQSVDSMKQLEQRCISQYGEGNYSIVCEDNVCGCNHEEVANTPYCISILCLLR